MSRRKVLWLIVAMLAAFTLWVLSVNITDRRNVRNLPTEYEPLRDVITQLCRT